MTRMEQTFWTLAVILAVVALLWLLGVRIDITT